MQKKIDLHVHSKASDGLYSPSELIDYAISRNISVLGLCDHDTVAGVPEAVKYAGKKNMELIPGVEFSLNCSGGSFHLVGLFIDHQNKRMLEITEKLKESRMGRVEKMVESLVSDGYEISLEDIINEAKGAALGKPHIARILVRKGYAKDMFIVFKTFMCHGKPGYVKRERISFEEAVSVIKESGGISILAHPISLNLKTFKKYESFIDDLKERGLDGIEAYSSMHSMKEVSEFLRIADKFNMIVSGGSDFHGDKGKVLGVYTDGNYIPAQILENIKSYISEVSRK
ncbi:MAG: PHP domain-containing protein [Spirochaetes bacterium]|nr:PHP domain-containing protein [Spirochaetota bacterium]